ncbi:NADPH-dependent 2,4-dienoyl-CoA reductase, sulfur reductase [Alkalibacterium subtropicum]|uniref:NADPH-dependent 2,4-dienoyl-CoA reductase, sulfur reductase n=1 Tax=Alkalibacterium subtropicum TaxID=753702 RepID=A0A1I1FJW4_9LACT|nr:FAD/NAD(P)-binding oxidoreductase [Alkalibacterium subtropicum]SFB99635.1 NADPH-dependent 2,4-dienoyl-CoA reductase, sulfur reductase [Alkalibacterium subtropicum]
MKDSTETNYDYLFIGGGIAAGYAAEGIREIDKKGSIGILSSDQDGPYTRPALSKKIWTDDAFTTEDVPFDTAEETGADVILDTVVTKIDRENKTVTTEDGKSYTYGKLLLVTGGEPQTLEGPEDDHVIAFRSFEDYRKLRDVSGNNQHVIVVGGSYIGTELAANLKLNNTQVTLVYPQQVLGDTRFPLELAKEYEDSYRGAGVTLMHDSRADSYSKKDGKLVLELNNGETVEGDALVLGLGVKPRLALAEKAGLDVEDGVIVDEYFQTSDPDIYAAGDISAYPDPILGRHRIEHVDHARKSGTAVGKSMAGAGEPYDYTPYFYSKVFDISWKAIGTLDPDLHIFIDHVDEGKVAYYLKEGKPVGILTWNVDADLDKVREVLKNPPETAEDLRGLIRDKENDA